METTLRNAVTDVKHQHSWTLSDENAHVNFAINKKHLVTSKEVFMAQNAMRLHSLWRTLKKSDCAFAACTQ